MRPGIAPAPLAPGQAEAWMEAALREARLAFDRDEPPVGCIVINRLGEIVGHGGDHRQAGADPLGHAEVAAIRQAATAQGDWRLDGHTLVVTLEPCPMCAGLILMSRVGRVIYGAANDKWGAAGTRINVLATGAFPHRPEILIGVLEPSCAAILSEFFRKRRGYKIIPE